MWISKITSTEGNIYITSSCKTIRNYKEHNKKLAKDEIFTENTNVQ